MLNTNVMQILENGLNEQTAIDYISSRALLEANGYTIANRKVYDSEGNDCAYLHQYCYKLGTMERKAPTKTISEPRKTSDLEKLNKCIHLFDELCEKYNIKQGLAPQTFARIKSAIKAEQEAAMVDAEIAKTEQKNAIMKKIAALQAKAAAL